MTDGGNFEGSTILNVVDRSRVPRLRDLRQRLYEIRERRVRPARDDKQLAGWNGLMVRGVAEAARAFGRDDHRVMAMAAGEFLFRERVERNRALRSARGSEPIMGVLEDQAAVGLAAVSLYELTFDRTWLDRAVGIANEMIAAFWDAGEKTFFDTALDHEKLIVRPRDVTDNALPAGSSLACDLLARLGILMANDEFRRIASSVIDSLAEPIARHPLAFGHLLGVADMLVNGSTEIAIIGTPSASDFRGLDAAIGQTFIPALIVAGGQDDGIPLLAGRTTINGVAAAYVCRNFVCDTPVTDPRDLSSRA